MVLAPSVVDRRSVGLSCPVSQHAPRHHRPSDSTPAPPSRRTAPREARCKGEGPVCSERAPEWVSSGGWAFGGLWGQSLLAIGAGSHPVSGWRSPRKIDFARTFERRSRGHWRDLTLV
ncbi:hypothetical protein chiPu_0028550 [Chiloscyllium punctatum]|uniref:Uncharacterized protein n=1 Tax=Chiloscyllium punctatum TaxID=137246 RepID=A0A401TPB7_CHIPU|nr:hypothetical protein [Chiloscyllium punctatum]